MTVRLHWDLLAPADLETTWRAISDTDRFNRMAGLGFQFDEQAQPDGSVKRLGKAQKLGLTLVWDEHPFEFVAPRGFRTRRTFHGGPLAELATSVALEERENGTAISYTVELNERSVFFRPILHADAALNIRPQLDRVLRRLVASLAGNAEPLDPPPKLTAAAAELVERLTARIEPPPLREALRRRLDRAPLVVQDRLQALQIAAELKLSPEVVLASLLQAVRDGLLELRWELLCPRCQGPKETRAALDVTPGSVHCPSCNIRYDATFPDSVAVVFRPSAQIRRFEAPVDCLLSPQRTPHVLGQALLRGDGQVAWQVALERGAYRLDASPSVGGAIIEVREGLPDEPIAVDITAKGLRPAILRVAPGPRLVALRNRLGSAATITLDRRERPPFTLTAGRLLELPGARDLLPAEALTPGNEVSVDRRFVLAATAFVMPGAASPDPRLVAAASTAEAAQFGDATVVLAFTDADTMLDAAASLSGNNDLSVGLSHGLCVRIDRGAARSLGGSAVDEALAVMREIGAGRVGVHVARKRADLGVACRLRGDATLEEPGEFCHASLRFAAGRERRQSAVNLIRAREGKSALPIDIGRFRIDGELSRGGHGQVLLATDTSTGSEVVVKVLRPELATDPEAIQRFYAEARFTAAVDHPAVVRALDYGETEEGRLYLALEKLAGVVLSERLTAGVLSPDETRQLGVRLCGALEAAHAAKILHRDLKPANVFLVQGSPKQAKLLDFGVAHPLGEDDPAAEAGTMLGTPEYMSPEQVEGDPLDARSDVYALGTVLYECLAGRLPFDGQHVAQVAFQRTARDPRPLSETATQAIPEGLASAVMRSIELDPPRRWPSAEAFAAALRATKG